MSTFFRRLHGESTWQQARVRIVKYLVSGGVYFWSGYVVFAIVWSGLHWQLWWAKLAANLVGWGVNFGLQHWWVFARPVPQRRSLRAGMRYGAITLFDFLLDYAIVASLKRLGLTPYLGQFVSAAFFTFWNYYWYRFWVFPLSTAKKGSA